MHKVALIVDCFISLLSTKKMSYYAVRSGRNPGIYSTWDDCKNQVHQFPGAKYKKFSSKAEAQDFVNGGSSSYSGYSAPRSYGKSTSSSYRSYSTSSYASRNEDDAPAPKRTKYESSSSTSTTKMKYVGRNYFQVDNDDHVNVWTDGACSKNGRTNAKAGIGAFFDFDHPLNISRPVDTRSTNNYAEIKAVTEAAKQAANHGVTKLKVNTDSQFLINCANSWMSKWKSNGWKTSNGDSVINKNELLEMEKAISKFESVKWNHVRGHRGNVGNEMADQLARRGADQN